MAMINIIDYKTDLIKDLIRSEAIIKGIDSQQDGIDPDSADTLIYKNIFPYMKIKATQNKADSYIMLATDILNVNKNNPTYATYCVKIRIFVHDDRMQMKGRNGTRLDFLYEEIKHLFDGQTKYGFSEFEFSSRIEDVYNESYHFADLTFYTNDLRKSVKKKG